MASLNELLVRVRCAVAWEVGRSLWFNSRERVTENLSTWDCQDFAAIVRKRPGRPWNLSEAKGRQLVGLVKQAATGRPDPSWNAIGISIVTLLVPRVVSAAWQRRPVPDRLRGSDA